MTHPVTVVLASTPLFKIQISIPQNFTRKDVVRTKGLVVELFTFNDAYCQVQTIIDYTKPITASGCLKACQENLSRDYTNIEIIEDAAEVLGWFPTNHKLIMAYNDSTNNNQREVMVMQFFQNSAYTCSGFFYAVPVAHYQTTDAAVQQVKSFIKQNCKILP
ncbi:hypothetical protein M1466_02370 [Candidatus Dependentiae bacterium]|nr:hypothetical protein [Candidatus Dependentiae bacterium]